jgi:RNA polymerase sigma-70 factor (subfamily 1)
MEWPVTSAEPFGRAQSDGAVRQRSDPVRSRIGCIEDETVGREDLAELVARAQTGDADAMETLVEACLNEVKTFVHLQLDGSFGARESESDVVQSVCRNVIENLPKLQYRGRANFRSWLYTVTLNRVRQKWNYHFAQKRDMGRERGTDSSSSLESSAFIAAVQPSPSEIACAREQAERIEKAMERLPPDYRQVLQLARVERMDHAEIAFLMKRSRGAVRTLLSRASVRLLAELEKRSEHTPRG